MTKGFQKFSLVILVVLFLSFEALLLLNTLNIKPARSKPKPLNLSPPSRLPQVAAASTSAIPAPEEIKVPILTYHYVRVVPNPAEDKLGVFLSVTPAVLRQELTYLKDNGYTVIDFDQLEMALKGKTTLPKKGVILTFDDGYEDFYTSGLPIIKEFKVPVTLFMVAGFVNKNGYLNENQLKEVDQSGLVKIGVHSYTHTNLANPNTNLKREIYLAKKTMEDLLGHELDTFAYPYGTYSNQSLAAVKGAGFKLAASTDSGFEQSETNRFRLRRNRPGSSLYQLKIALGEMKQMKKLNKTP